MGKIYYINDHKLTKWPQNVTNGHFTFQGPAKIPKLGFWYENIPYGNTA
jgi:hypothetical protein